MLILLVQLDIEIEQVKCGLLREYYLLKVCGFGISALFSKIAEFDACISRSMARLSSFVKEIVQPLACKPKDRIS